MSDNTTQESGIFVEIKGFLGRIADRLDRQAEKEVFTYSIFRTLTAPTAVAGTSPPLVVSVGSPPLGSWWLVRQVRVTGEAITAIPSVNVDVYVTGSRLLTGAPPVSDWRGASGTSASSPGLPVVLVPGTREFPVQGNEHVVVVLTGAGVTSGTQFHVAITVEQFQAFAGLVRTGESR